MARQRPHSVKSGRCNRVYTVVVAPVDLADQLKDKNQSIKPQSKERQYSQNFQLHLKVVYLREETEPDDADRPIPQKQSLEHYHRISKTAPENHLSSQDGLSQFRSPSGVRPGETLYPSPVVKPSYASGALWAYVTLVNDFGQIVQKSLVGTLVDSARPLPDISICYYPRPDRDDMYIVFSNLAIGSEGHFRLRITLMTNSGYGTASLEEVESQTKAVHNRARRNARLGRQRIASGESTN